MKTFTISQKYFPPKFQHELYILGTQCIYRIPQVEMIINK